MRQCRFSRLLLTIISGWMASNFCYALPYTITAVGALPTSYPSHASFLITKNTNVGPDTNLIKWLPPNVSIIASGTTCATSLNTYFTLAKGQSCVLNVLVSGPVSASDPNPDHHLMICLSDRTSCAGPNPENSLNVVRKRGTPRFAFVANNSAESVLSCPVKDDGKFEACVPMTDSTFRHPTGIAILGQTAYVASNGVGLISSCPIKPDGTFAPCTAINDITFSSPEGVAFNPAGTFIYVVNFTTSSISLCPVIDGVVSPCSLINDATFNNTLSVAFSQDGSEAYVTNSGNGTISLCPVLNNGTFGPCIALTDPNFDAPEDIAINFLYGFAYITDHADNQVLSCPVLNDGTFGLCTPYTSNNVPGANFSAPYGVAITFEGTAEYVVSEGGNIVSLCSLLSNGALGFCQTITDASFDAPAGIALYY